MKFLAVDTETGGLTTNNSLLTVYMAVFDKDLKIVADLDLKLKPNDDRFVTQETAMQVNGINLAEHSKEAIPYAQAQPAVENFLDKHTNSSKDKLVLIAQNATFDKMFLQEYLIHKTLWNKYFDKAELDPTSIIALMQVLGLVPENLRRNLGTMAEFFGVRYINAHDAKADIKITVRVLERMLRTLKSGKIL